MTRQEHLDWCKQRAIEFVDIGDINQAWSSMKSDIGKHEKTCNHPAIALGEMIMMIVGLKTQQDMRRFIDGFS
jgi:hypothetical protein